MSAFLREWRLGTADEMAIREVFKDLVYEGVKTPSLGDIVVDAGAHIGAFTVKASLQIGTIGKVYAFEPEPENFSFLQTNTKGLNNVEIFQLALWSSEDNRTLYKTPTHTVGHSFYYQKDWGNVPSLVVRTVELDKIVKQRVDFLKIDVEGSELEVLKGSTKILKTSKPFIAMEIHGLPLICQVISFLSNYGYQSKMYTVGNIWYFE